MTFKIFRKPTTNDTTIPNDSYHPLEQKFAAIRYFANRIHTYNLDHLQKQKETDIVKQVIHNNKYDTSLLNRFSKNTIQRQRHKQENQNQRWVTFTYVGRETRYITKLFRNPSLKVAYTTNSNFRPFHVRFWEHYRDYKFANNKSKFAQHIIEEGHAVHIANKGRMLDTLERFYIYRETRLGTQINDKLTVRSNPIFEALLPNDPHRGH